MAWYSKSFRRNLVDMHIADWDEKFFSEFDPRAYFECLKAGRIQSPMIYLQSHVGLCNWDSKSGRTHRAFQGRNKVRELIDLCHGAGMDVIAYYSLIYNNLAYEDHPAWRMLDEQGHPSRSDATLGFMSGGRYGLLCPNQAGYREFLLAQFREFTQAYDFEGLFLDMTFWPKVCYCPACRARYLREAGRALPERVDWNDEGWRAFQAARQRWMGEFASFCTAALKELKPGLAIEHQFSTICHHWRYGVDEGVGEACDYAGGDLYGGHLQQSYICKVFYEATNNQPFEYMTSRCDPGLSLHTTTKTLRDLKKHNYLTLAHHGAFLVIDAIDPVGTLNRAVYERIGEVFRESMPYEPFLTGEMQAEAALVMSYDSKYDAAASPEQPSRANLSHPQLEAQLGMARVLREMRMTYTALPGNRLSRLEGKRLAVVTDAAQLREAQIEAIAAFARAGGSVYLSGATDPRLAEALLGLTYKGHTKERNTYLAPTDLGRAAFGAEYSAKYPLNFKGAQPIVENPLGHAVLATVALPYTDPADPATFASIHSNPPGPLTEHPAAILGQCGAGRVLWLSAAIEANQQDSYRGVVSRLVQLLARPERIASDAPACVEFTLFRDGERLILHAVNELEEPDLPVPPFAVRVRADAPIRRVLRAPDLTEVPAIREGLWIEWRVEALDLFETYLLAP